MKLSLSQILPHTVDREIFVIKNFSPVAWVAKIKRAKVLSRYTHNVNRGQVAKIKRAKINLIL